MLRSRILPKQPQRAATECTCVARQQQIRSLFPTPSRSVSYRRFGQPGPSAEPQQHQEKPQGIYIGQLQRKLFLQSPQVSGWSRLGGSGGGGQSGGRGGKGFSNESIKVLILIGGLAGGYYIFHLEQVPETGRWRFIDVGPEQEHSMGAETYQQVLQEYKGRILPASHPHSKHVRRVASRIIAALDKAVQNQPDHTRGDAGMFGGGSGEGNIAYVGSSNAAAPSKSKTEWQVFVINDSEQKNAFVLPGGKIFDFTGILPICENEDGLATVLGHEVAHQVARHSAEKVSGYKVLIFGAMALELLGLDIDLSRAALTLLLSLPNSRKTELEADYIGLRIMARACFDPREASKLWQRMQASEGGGGGGGTAESAKAILSTHPISSKRIQNMEEWLPEAMSTRAGSDCPNPEQVSGFQSAIRRF